jgi:hypothetical protein
MAGHGEKLGRKQEEAIAALLSQRNIEEAARAAGVGTRTLIRWLKLPEFGKEYRKARHEAVHQSVARLQQATGAAATIVLKLMTDPNVPAAVKLRAAYFDVFQLDSLERAINHTLGRWRRWKQRRRAGRSENEDHR